MQTPPPLPNKSDGLAASPVSPPGREAEEAVGGRRRGGGGGDAPGAGSAGESLIIKKENNTVVALYTFSGGKRWVEGQGGQDSGEGGNGEKYPYCSAVQKVR